MAMITRTVTAEHLIEGHKYRRSKRLLFDPDKVIDSETAKAHLRVHYPNGYVVCIDPHKRGPKGGWGAARFYEGGQVFKWNASMMYWFLATPAVEGSATAEKAHREIDAALERRREWDAQRRAAR